MLLILLGMLLAWGWADGVWGEPESTNWVVAGKNIHNTRHQPYETRITPANVSKLAPKWVFRTGGDVSATPAVDDEAVYFPDWAGNLFKIDAETGQAIWSRRIEEYTEVPGDFSRNTPAIYGNKLIFGDQGGRLNAGARVMAVNKEDGDLVWVTQVDDHFAAFITQSAVVHDETAYVGVSSGESLTIAATPGYACCTFRGSIVALDANTGDVIWKTYTVPTVADEFPGYSGGPVWGGTPVVDVSRGSLYITTGNNYTVPPSAMRCVQMVGVENALTCMAPDNYFDSVIALDLETGTIKWGRHVLSYDAWHGGCGPTGESENCPVPLGPDHDLSAGPMLFTVTDRASGERRDLIGAGQKSGKYWALDPDSGDVMWVTQVGPGGVLGGIQWGAATDDQRIYVANANSEFREWELLDRQLTRHGFWSALDPVRGDILWQTPDANFAWDQAAVTVANGVLYAGSLDPEGHMYALDAMTGDILWAFASGGSVNAGPAVVDGTVYWGSGYKALPKVEGRFVTGNDKFYAFEVKPASEGGGTSVRAVGGFGETPPCPSRCTSISASIPDSMSRSNTEIALSNVLAT